MTKGAYWGESQTVSRFLPEIASTIINTEKIYANKSLQLSFQEESFKTVPSQPHSVMERKHFDLK